MDNTNYRCFAPCPRGLEALLQQELAALGATDLRPTEGGVGFSGTLAIVYRTNLESRIASRILLEVAQVSYRNEQDIYAAASALPWPQWFQASRTIKVKTSAQHCPLKSLDFVTLRIKDAICDTFTKLKGARPSVNSNRPDIRIDAFLDATQLTLYLGTTGDSLFKRGFRESTVDAPLRENLAAGIVQLTGWNGTTPLLDPLCGGGTIPLEAAMLARNIAPGLGRRFAFELFSNFDAALWKTVQAQAHAKQLPASPAPIYASDRDARAVQTAKDQFIRAGVADNIALSQTDLFDLTPPQEPGIIVMNPPYGVRLGTQADLDVFYPKLGAWLKTRCVGWRVYLFTGDLRAPKLIGLAPTKRTPLFNGAIECRLYEFIIVQGGARRRLTAPTQT
ncbi:THUMP domain-containing class I SAM-dependent RNA methyltransferase [Nitrospira lenta]|uniref:Ribosomal RNA large subunit methyltransferase L n=1 Tax=Nitrospira lenta TaxID=1436998 RepID=A0A330L6M5_9BACT|nr:THUMP domain-containing protein [Nitrospira lenta]SPP65354.1 Ribosomal RNA large subunit methyltransferase L [Nitrospira lenta]